MIRRPPPASAITFVVGVAFLFTSGAVALRVLLGEAGLPLAHWAFFFVPALVFVRAGGFDPAESLFLATPSRRALSGALLLVVGAAPVAWAMVWIQSFFLQTPPAVVAALEELVRADSPVRMAWLLFAVALTPALCEEVVFRGVLLSSTRALPTWKALLLNGVVFGAFHLSLETPVRFLPTAWLGIVIAWTVLRTGSIWTGVLMHLVNNGAILVLAWIPAWRSLVLDPEAPPPLWLMGVAFAALVAGRRTLGRVPVQGSGPITQTNREQT